MAVKRLCTWLQYVVRGAKCVYFLWESVVVRERALLAGSVFTGWRLHVFVKEIVTTEDDLGITDVDGLSNKDLDRVRSLALIDLTALFDLHGITYVRRKAKGRGRGRWCCLLQSNYHFLCCASCHSDAAAASLQNPLGAYQLVVNLAVCYSCTWGTYEILRTNDE